MGEWGAQIDHDPFSWERTSLQDGCTLGGGKRSCVVVVVCVFFFFFFFGGGGGGVN